MNYKTWIDLKLVLITLLYRYCNLHADLMEVFVEPALVTKSSETNLLN